MSDLRTTQLNKGLDALAPMLDADGFELVLGTIDADRVEVILRPRSAACLECLVPDDVLRSILLSELQKHDPQVESIDLIKQGFE